jgi:hypothetical protein
MKPLDPIIEELHFKSTLPSAVVKGREQKPFPWSRGVIGIIIEEIPAACLPARSIGKG